MSAREARVNAAPELALELLGIEPEPLAAAPAMNLRLRLRRPDGGPVQCVLLTTTVTIAAARRRCDDAERARLAHVAGGPPDASPTGLLWARVGVTVPTFRDETEVSVALPCGHDMQDAADQYLRALAGGTVPLDLAFDGTVFYPGEDGVLRTGQIPCRHTATGELPVAAWRSLVDRYYGAVRWLRLDEERFDRLAAYRARRAHTSFDDTVDELLSAVEVAVEPDESGPWTP